MPESLWAFLENRPAARAVQMEWQKRTGDNYPAVAPLLRPAGSLARTYPSTAPLAAPLRVVDYRDGRFAAVSEEGERIELSREQVILYQLDPRLLRKAICAALPQVIVGKTTPELTTPMLLGHWEPKKSAAFPIYLLLGGSADALIRQLLTLPTDRREAMVLTPTRQHWTDRCQAFCKQHMLLLVALSEILKWVSVRWEALPAWQEYLQAFCQLAGTSLPANLQNKKRLPQRATRTAAIEKLEKALEAHLRAARDHAQHLIDTGREPLLLPRPEQKQLAKETKLSVSAVSRALSDRQARTLKMLWDAADSLETVLKFKK